MLLDAFSMKPMLDMPTLLRKPSSLGGLPLKSLLWLLGSGPILLGLLLQRAGPSEKVHQYSLERRTEVRQARVLTVGVLEEFMAQVTLGGLGVWWLYDIVWEHSLVQLVQSDRGTAGRSANLCSGFQGQSLQKRSKEKLSWQVAADLPHWLFLL